MLLVSTSVLANECVDLSGDFSTMKKQFMGGIFVATLRQSSCSTIGIGSYMLMDESVEDEIEPLVTYVTANSVGKCDVSSCTVYENSDDGILFQKNGKVETKKGLCRYNRMSWELNDENDLVQTYFIDDEGFFCKETESVERVLKRVVKGES